MPREVISIGIGQGGVQLSNACWEVRVSALIASQKKNQNIRSRPYPAFTSEERDII